MVYEIAVFPIHDGKIEMFRRAFEGVTALLRRAKGYQGHLLTQGIEVPERFTLIVKWAKLEDHTPGFEASDDHQNFMGAVQGFFSDEPFVYHVQVPPKNDGTWMEADDSEQRAHLGF